MKISTKIELLAGRASARESHFSGSSGSSGLRILLQGLKILPGLRGTNGTQNEAKARERRKKFAKELRLPRILFIEAGPRGYAGRTPRIVMAYVSEVLECECRHASVYAGRTLDESDDSSSDNIGGFN